MFDPNTQSLDFHLKDLERKCQPRMRDYRKPNNRANATLRVISVIGLLALTVPFLPIG